MNYIKWFQTCELQILIPVESREWTRDSSRRSGRVNELACACALSERLLEPRQVARLVVSSVVPVPAPVPVPGGSSLCLCLRRTLGAGLAAGARREVSVLYAIAVALSSGARPGAESRPKPRPGSGPRPRPGARSEGYYSPAQAGQRRLWRALSVRSSSSRLPHERRPRARRLLIVYLLNARLWDKNNIKFRKEYARGTSEIIMNLW